MNKVITIIGLLSISLTAAARIIGKAEVTKSLDQMKLAGASPAVSWAPGDLSWV